MDNPEKLADRVHTPMTNKNTQKTAQYVLDTTIRK
jgi:hypothetical protein